MQEKIFTFFGKWCRMILLWVVVTAIILWEVYNLAKKMIEEILLAEKEAEETVTDAKIKAEEILKNSQLSDGQKKLQLEEEAKRTAEEIIASAKIKSDGILEKAKNESAEENKKLEELFAENKASAIACAVAVLAE